jgi:hypothetical protein
LQRREAAGRPAPGPVGQRVSGNERGKSASGSAMRLHTLRSAQARDRVRLCKIPLNLLLLLTNQLPVARAQEDIRLRPLCRLVSAAVPGTPRPRHPRSFFRAAILPPHRYHPRELRLAVGIVILVVYQDLLRVLRAAQDVGCVGTSRRFKSKALSRLLQ